MQRIRLLSLVAAILFVLAGAADAHAGQYTLSYDFGADLSGWSGYVEPGYNLCGRGATAGCPDVSTNRIMARAGSGQAIWSQGRWEWTAPPGTTIVGGSLAYRTRMRHSQFYARVKMRSAGDWDDAPTLLAEQQTTTLTDHVIALAERIPTGRHLALRASRRRRARHRPLGRLRHARADGRHGLRCDSSRRGVDGRRRPARRRVAPRRRVRHRRGRRQRVRHLGRSGWPATASPRAGRRRARDRSINLASRGDRRICASQPRRSATACTQVPWAVPT